MSVLLTLARPSWICGISRAGNAVNRLCLSRRISNYHGFNGARLGCAQVQHYCYSNIYKVLFYHWRDDRLLTYGAAILPIRHAMVDR